MIKVRPRDGEMIPDYLGGPGHDHKGPYMREAGGPESEEEMG